MVSKIAFFLIWSSFPPFFSFLFLPNWVWFIPFLFLAEFPSSVHLVFSGQIGFSSSPFFPSRIPWFFLFIPFVQSIMSESIETSPKKLLQQRTLLRLWLGIYRTFNQHIDWMERIIWSGHNWSAHSWRVEENWAICWAQVLRKKILNLRHGMNKMLCWCRGCGIWCF